MSREMKFSQEKNKFLQVSIHSPPGELGRTGEHSDGDSAGGWSGVLLAGQSRPHPPAAETLDPHHMTTASQHFILVVYVGDLVGKKSCHLAYCINDSD